MHMVFMMVMRVDFWAVGFLSSHPSTRNLINYVEVLNVLAIDDYACTVRRLLMCGITYIIC